MRRVRLYDSRLQLVTDRVDAPKEHKVVTYRNRIFLHIATDVYIEVSAAAAVEWPERSENLPFAG